MVRAETRSAASSAFTPIILLEANLDEALPAVMPVTTDGDGRALVLIRLHDVPLDAVEIEVPPDGVTREQLAEIIWARCQGAVRAHMRADGLSEPTGLPSTGLRVDLRPPCQAERDSFLCDAPAVTILIPTRERPDRLQRCIDSILASAYPRERVHVVIADNAPVTNRTRELAEELSAVTYGRVEYVREDVPGSASARNRGLTAVETEVVAMTDDDVIVDRHWLAEVARAFAEHPAAGAVSGLLWPAELETAAQLWFEQYGGFSRGFDSRVFDLATNRPANEPLYPWNAGLFGTGNNFSFRTGILREIGGFDPALGNGTPALGGVDSEILLRTILSGYQIVYEPRALAYHAHRSDYEGLRRQIYAYGAGLVAYYL